jgi:hypothetical protein
MSYGSISKSPRKFAAMNRVEEKVTLVKEEKILLAS